MFWSERSVQDHKRRTDCALHRAFGQLVSDPLALRKFREFLACTRERSPRLFEAPVVDDRHAGIDALVQLARFRGLHIRRLSRWRGTDSSWQAVVASLARHLVCRYRVPVFLSACWYATDEAADERRGWFVAHSRGRSFRSLDLPMVMTRKMERIFLASQDHMPIEYAMRRAELLALGAPAEFVQAIMATRLGTELGHSEFWRTVWIFLIANAGEADADQIGPMIDYIQAAREDRGREGMEEFGAPRPVFSMKGRTVPSVLRLMEEWHRCLGAGRSVLSWERSTLKPLLVEELSPDGSEVVRRWQMMELVNSGQLRSEGARLRHCVASYADRCHCGDSTIWSLRCWQDETFHHVLTVQVDPKRRVVDQARGRANRMPSGRPLGLLQEWAAQEGLRMAV